MKTDKFLKLDLIRNHLSKTAPSHRACPETTPHPCPLPFRRGEGERSAVLRKGWRLQRFMENLLSPSRMHWDNEPRRSATAAEMTGEDSPSPIGWERAGGRARVLLVRFMGRYGVGNLLVFTFAPLMGFLLQTQAQPNSIEISKEVGPGKERPIWVSMSGFTGE